MSGHDIAKRLLDRAKAMGLAEDLARLAHMSDGRLRRIWHGDAYSAVEYEQLCRALAVDPTLMYCGEETRPQTSPARFRSAFTVDRPSGRDIRLLALAVEQGRILAHLLRLLEREVTLGNARSVQPPSQVRESWREGYDLGEAARQTLHPQQGPVLSLEELLNQLGIHVARATLTTPDVDAASLWEPEAVPVVLLNKASDRYAHPGALRATLAHELCHLVHDAGEQNLTTQVSWGIEHRGNHEDSVEKRARAFAPAFLAPREQTKDWYQRQPRSTRNDPKRTVHALAKHWGLSFEGAAWHAKNCGIVESQAADKLATQPHRPPVDYSAFSTDPVWIPPAMIHQELPEQAAEPWDGWATQVVLDALAEGHISIGRARELLTWG